MKSLSECEKAYLAGIIDGEASLGVNVQANHNRDNRTVYRPRLIICNSNPELIRYLEKTLGPTSTVIVRQRKPTHKISYQYEISSRKKLVSIRNNILPFLRLKKRQTELVLKWCESREKAVRGSYYNDTELKIIQELYKLNRRGVV